jgi:branched-chain amino acid transport system permease protein
MGFVALGGLAAVLVSTDPVSEAWNAGGLRILFALAVGVGIIGATIIAYRRITATRPRLIAMVTILGLGFFAYRALLDPAVEAVEAVNPALQGNLGGLDLPIILAWPVGGLFAAGAAWIIGKAALGLRSDYLAIATLGISEIIIAILKNEDWLARGVKNVIGLDRPVPKEIDLQESAEFIERASGLGLDPVTASALFVKLNYALLFSVVLIILLVMAQLSLKSPWGRMMRAIRDNETAAAAMGKNVTNRHLQIFILGSAICGIAGAMMTTLDGQLTPGSYQPLRFTFLIWVGQQLWRGARRVPDLVPMGSGRTDEPISCNLPYCRYGRRQCRAPPHDGKRRLYAIADHGAGFVVGSAVQSTWVDPREVDNFID